MREVDWEWTSHPRSQAAAGQQPWRSSLTFSDSFWQSYRPSQILSLSALDRFVSPSCALLSWLSVYCENICTQRIGPKFGYISIDWTADKNGTQWTDWSANTIVTTGVLNSSYRRPTTDALTSI